jgi:hypothetical protein
VNRDLCEETPVRHTNEGGSPHERGSESCTPRLPRTYADSGLTPFQEENLHRKRCIGVGPDGQTVADGLAPGKGRSEHSGGPGPSPGQDHADSANGLSSSATPSPQVAPPPFPEAGGNSTGSGPSRLVWRSASKTLRSLAGTSASWRSVRT